MATTDSIRGVCAELDRRGLAPRRADIYLPNADDRGEFVRVARTFAANKVDHNGSFLWASREDGMVDITVFAGEWWQQVVAYLDAPTVFEAVRREILTVADDVGFMDSGYATEEPAFSSEVPA